MIKRKFIYPMEIRVAIFEDNKLVRDAYEAILNGSAGFICTGAFPDGNNPDLAVRKSNPDVILMDIEMPGSDGIAVTRYITQHYPDIRILIQTVFEDDHLIFSAICAGASGYLLKSNGMASLLQGILEVYNGGAPMSPQIASRVLRLFQKFAPPPTDKNDSYSLSDREKQILSSMVEGLNFHAIAEKSFISYETVRTHVKKIYKKLHVTSASEAVILALKKNIV
jgi:DNA-binding NarL/FixJ family response regulator